MSRLSEPCLRLEGLDTVTVGASDHTLVTLDLFPRCPDRLRRGEVHRLANHVVYIERSPVCFVSTIDTSLLDLVGREPFPHHTDAPVLCLSRRSCPRGVSHSSVVFRGSRFGVVRPLWPRSALTKRRTEFCSALRLECPAAALTNPVALNRVIPGRHEIIIPDSLRFYPCKPDIFEATYEAV